jgi:hypothetical protein
VAAALDPEIKAERLFAWTGPITINDVLATMREMYPDHAFIDDLQGHERAHITKDDTVERSLLKKWACRDDWLSLEQTILDGMEEIA